jgi:hypothetical protein
VSACHRCSCADLVLIDDLDVVVGAPMEA